MRKFNLRNQRDLWMFFCAFELLWFVKRLATFNPKILESDLPAKLEKELSDSMRAEQTAAAGK